MTLPSIKLHIRQQEAGVLLDPIRLELIRLSTRLDHQIAKLNLDDASIDDLVRARTAINQAIDAVASIEMEANQR